MKIIKSNVELIKQGPGLEGLYKFIELVGRVAYKSEDLITEDSYKRFNKMIYDKGHFAVFDLGTVYLTVPSEDLLYQEDLIELIKETSPWTKFSFDEEFHYITTNYRIICQRDLQEYLELFWSEPTSNHYQRTTLKWTCSRVIAQEILRHRVLCPVMESTRYINYNRDKFGGITYILPQWVYEIRKDIAETICPLTKESREYILDLDGQELWNKLCVLDRTVSSRAQLFELAESQYLFESTTEESHKLKVEDARGCLPLDVKTEVCTTGYNSDWLFNPKEGSTEKAGFFNLRLSKASHPDIRVLAEKALDIFKDNKIDTLK